MDTLTFDLAPDEREIFLADVDEHLRAIESGILDLERGISPNVVDTIFRSAHTLKALAGMIGHHRMAELTHAVETLFEALRDGQASLTPTAADDLLAVVDALTGLRDEVVSGTRGPVDVAALIGKIATLLHGGLANQAAPARATATRLTPEQRTAARQAREAGETLLEIEVVADVQSAAPAAQLYEAALVLSEAGRVLAAAPMLDDVTHETTALWTIIATTMAHDAIVQLLRQIPGLAKAQVYTYEIDSGPGIGTVPAGHDPDKTVRISIERLDVLMNLVGELVTDRTRLFQLAAAIGEHAHAIESIGALNELTTHLGRVVGQLQEEVMRARMLPIASLFDKFPRLVRDVARAAVKQVELRIAGASTELDRSIIEGLHDPLIHLVRNAIDHGIEPPSERAAIGKPPSGTLRLAAAYTEGHIVITLADDGRGIDPRRIGRAAVERGLIADEDVAQLGDDALIDMIFWPRLSTAEQITELSGRGIGMDAVRAHVERLNGTIAVESRVAHGTTFYITVPLTLTIVPTMLVSLGDHIFAVPLASIIDMWSLNERAVSTVKGSPTIRWHDTILPLLELRQVFDHPRIAEEPRGAKSAIVTVGWGKLRAGLIVDRIIGQQEVVVKTLSPIIGVVPCLSGSATLGDGRIALIVDVPGLMKAALVRSNTTS